MYYVIQVQSGKEDKVIEEIKSHKDHDPSFDIFTPCRTERRKYKDGFKDIKVKCFPGYIFAETNNVKQLINELYWAPDYARLLGKEKLNDNYLPLSEEESRVIDILYNAENDRTTPIMDIEVLEGDRIRVVSGPLMGQESVVKKVDLHKRRIKITTTLAGRGVEAYVAINIVTKTNI